ncbi:Rap guanine nucleotide exchange factor 4 [Halotydeus destructor]|nr:Rap guanine nucleotide exchange factor 4 [Halotydeus destructor]
MSCQEPSSELLRVGWVLRTVLLTSSPTLMRDRKSTEVGQPLVNRKCLLGTEMVDWLLGVSSSTPLHVHSRAQAVAMWQVLLEEGVLRHVQYSDDPFCDKLVAYRFWFDDEGKECFPASQGEQRIAEMELPQSLSLLTTMAPDAAFRLLLKKGQHERSEEDTGAIYEELMHIKALSHLSNSIRKELASVIAFESHPKAGTLIFSQGDSGTSWFIILKGSVNVIIVGKGVVCTLQAGDDFGKLALVNDAPRAASIVTAEDNAHFLRVDKEHFDRILRDVEANTVRLVEHGKEVLVLQKMAAKSPTGDQLAVTGPAGSGPGHYKYLVIAGTPEKMLEHCLETRVDISTFQTVKINGRRPSTLNTHLDPGSGDTFLEDLVLTHVIYMSTKLLCKSLQKRYNIDITNTRQENEFFISTKRRVIQFLNTWQQLIGEQFFADETLVHFTKQLARDLEVDSKKEQYKHCFERELDIMSNILRLMSKCTTDQALRESQKWKADVTGPIRRLSNFGGILGNEGDGQPVLSWLSVHPKDESKCTAQVGHFECLHRCFPFSDACAVITRIYCADHTYTTIKVSMDTTAKMVKMAAAEKLGLKNDDLVLAEVKSSGERLPFKDTEVSLPTSLSVNGRLFITLADHLDALTSLAEQDGPKEGTFQAIDDMSTNDIAYYFTQYSWSLFTNVHEYELIYHVFGRHNFVHITSNLDLFLRHFNELQYWVVTEIVLCNNISRRVQMLRKFIKLAGLFKEYQNLNGFFAICMGLSNVAVSRLAQTWDRLPSKVKRTFGQYESIIDPSRNHRRYRMYVAKLDSPIVPFVPLTLKDMTFADEGNKTFLDKGLVNFEKMSLRTLRFCRSRPFADLAIPMDTSVANRRHLVGRIEAYIRDMKVIDNQRLLNQYSHTIEYKK